jgi:hypothetical protein
VLKQQVGISASIFVVGNQDIEDMQQNLSKVNTRYICRDEKYGIQMPKSVNEALQINREIGLTYGPIQSRRKCG